MPEPTSPDPSAGRPAFSWKTWLKYGLTLVVVGFVLVRARILLKDADWSAMTLNPGWLIAAALLYAVGTVPSVWFWHTALGRLHVHPEWRLMFRAYYAGHLGKYVPGKAGVLLIRGGLLKERGHPLGAAIVTSALETILLMIVGAEVAVMLAGFLVPQQWLATHAGASWGRLLEHRWIPAAAVAVIIACGAPILSKLLGIVARKFAPVDPEAAHFPIGLLLRGTLAFAGTWLMFGMSLGAIIVGIGGRPVSWSVLTDIPVWTAAIAASTSIGFFALFAPAGLGVREAILIEILRFQPDISQETAVVASLLMRIISLSVEVTLAFGLPLLIPIPDTDAPSDHAESGSET